MIRLLPAVAVALAAIAIVNPAGAGRDRPVMATPARHAHVAPALARRLARAGPDQTVEAIVVLDRQAAMPGRRASRRATRIAELVAALKTTARTAQRPVLELLRQRRARGGVTKIVPLWIVDGVLVKATRRVLYELAARSDVSELLPNATIRAPAGPAADPQPEPNVSRINAPALWNLGFRGQGVVVANMDTGVDLSHPDLNASWRGGTNSWFDPNGEHPSAPADVSGHGTWTMGVMVGGAAGGTAIGVAPAAKWIAAKIFNDHGAATTARIHESFQWLLDPDGNPNTADAPNVVNDSWVGAAGCNLEFQPDLAALRAAGILPVFAAGNGGPNASTSFSPANNPGALAVGGTTALDAIDPTSSRGPSACGGVFPDLVAPGVDVRTTDLFGLYTQQSGTSIAAPHVTGVLALLLSAFPGLSADRQESAVENGAVDLGAPGPDNDVGHGRLDALAAYQWLASSPDFTLGASPGSSTVQRGGSASYTVSVGALNGFTGDVTLSLSGLTGAQGSWSFTPATVTGGSGSSRLDVTTSASIAPGTYPLTITATGGGLAHVVSVSLVVAPAPDFSLTASPGSAAVLAGGSATFAVSVASGGGFAGDVALSLGGLTSAQASWSFTPSTVTGGSGVSQLGIATAASLTPGVYPFTITGASGGLTHTTSISLVVSASPDFALAIGPPTATVRAGQAASYTVSVTGIGGFTAGVTLSAAGLPAGASATFAPNPLAPGASAILTVRTTRHSTRGTFTLAVTGKSGTRSHKVTATLIVKAPLASSGGRRALAAPRQPSRLRARARARAHATAGHESW